MFLFATWTQLFIIIIVAQAFQLLWLTLCSVAIACHRFTSAGNSFKYTNTKIHNYTNTDKRMHKCTAWTVSRASIKKPAAWNGFGQKGWFVLHSSPAVKVVRKIILFYTSPTSGNDLGTWEHNCMHECENKCAIYLCVCVLRDCD